VAKILHTQDVMKTIDLLACNDSALVRPTLHRIIGSDPDLYPKLHQDRSFLDTKDKSWFLSSFPLKSLNTGGNGFKAASFSLSTGGSHPISQVQHDRERR
jgi:hypothetical protein